MKRPTFHHPRVVQSTHHRPLGKLDWSIPKTPIHEVLGELEVYQDEQGWTALTVINGKLHRVRAGGSKGGPRSLNLGGSHPGVYAIDQHSCRIVELLAKAEAPMPCPLDCLDVVHVGYTEDEILGWDGWGDEEPVVSDEPVVVEVDDA